MAYIGSDIFELYFKEEKIGKVSKIHVGLGWITGSFELLTNNQVIIKFLKASELAIDLFGDNEEWDYINKNLSFSFGIELVDADNWRLKNLSTEKEEKLFLIPSVELDRNKICYKLNEY